MPLCSVVRPPVVDLFLYGDKPTRPRRLAGAGRATWRRRLALLSAAYAAASLRRQGRLSVLRGREAPGTALALLYDRRSGAISLRADQGHPPLDAVQVEVISETSSPLDVTSSVRIHDKGAGLAGALVGGLDPQDLVYFSSGSS